MKTKCIECKFFDKANESIGQCRRHAPIYEDNTHTTEWPWTNADAWCGDFQFKLKEEVLRK